MRPIRSRCPITLWLAAPDEHLEHWAWGDMPADLSQRRTDLSVSRKPPATISFVDRFTYNFRQPHRGEIIVFKTKGIRTHPGPGPILHQTADWLAGGNQSASAKTATCASMAGGWTPPRRILRIVYGFDPGRPPTRQPLQRTCAGIAQFACRAKQHPDQCRPMITWFLATTPSTAWTRATGAVPRHNVIGKAFFVYWPISDRFGWGQR